MRIRRAMWAACASLLLSSSLFAACGDDDDAGGSVVVIGDTPTTAVNGEVTAPPAITAGNGNGSGSTATPPPAATATTAPGNGGGVPPDTSVVVACGDILAPLDKEHRLAADCAPGDLHAIPQQWTANGTQHLRAEAAAALVEMFEAAAKEGHSLYGNSGYRSFATQEVVFAGEVASYGLEQAQRQSARAGHSEHQLGTTMDVTSPAVGNGLSQAFGDTPEGRWLAANAHRWGFVMSYPPGKEAVTGYIYEPWHFRYVGKGPAAAVRQSGLTLREYLLR